MSTEAVHTFYNFKDIICNKYTLWSKYTGDSINDTALNEHCIKDIKTFMLIICLSINKHYETWNKFKQNVDLN